MNHKYNWFPLNPIVSNFRDGIFMHLFIIDKELILWINTIFSEEGRLRKVATNKKKKKKKWNNLHNVVVEQNSCTVLSALKENKKKLKAEKYL